MVLYKRKPVQPEPRPAKVENNTELWVMPKTEEIFTDYESYLKRYDFYNQKRFTDAVNGKSGLTYFAALESENSSSSDIEKIFPDALRDPILRKVQFSDISRIDELVSFVFEQFKNDFFPGEEVNITLEGGDQFDGVIREKAKFPELRAPDGSIQRAAFSRYFVKINNNHGDEALLDDKHVKRDRKVFTKQNLRAFLKNSLTREPHIGALWLVKEHIARHYRLPMEVPNHVLHAAAAKNNIGLITSHFPAGQTNGASGPGPVQPAAAKAEPPKVLPPPIKYPIEDLDVAPKRNGNTRPRMKFITPESPGEDDILADSVGKLLEVWNTLNVQCQFFHLDSFTFDDFLEAMKYSLDDPRCELLDEMHCAVLTQLVNKEGALLATLPDMVEEEESDEEAEESEVATPVIDVPARSTRSRLSQVMEIARSTKSPSEARHRSHRAAEMANDWVERLQKRKFYVDDSGDGGWEVILVGLLYQLSLDPQKKSECDKILTHLAPLDEDPTSETASARYLTLDVNKRISALQMITLLAVSTKALRAYLEECSEAQTSIRKEKLESQKSRKEALARLSELDTQRKILAPENMPESPKEENTDPMDVDITAVTLDDTVDTVATPTSDMEEDEPIAGRSLRRANERKRKRDEDAARREKVREEKAAKIAKTAGSKQSKEYLKILSDIEKLKTQIVKYEEDIAICDGDLREASVQRTRVLGRDRFWNRYYWFERNGMPFGGLPDASTAHYGYANARIWVQGPDDMERVGFIDLSPDDQAAYVDKHGMTVPERKEQEEGSTRLARAEEWAYYDDPESIDMLLGWFDERGHREKALKKELLIWKTAIVEQMDKLKEHLEPKHEESDEEPTVRMSTRRKAYVDADTPGLRCLKWHNTAAIDEHGHIHSEPPRPKVPKSKSKAAPKEEKGVARTTNNNNNAKATKMSTRQMRSSK